MREWTERDDGYSVHSCGFSEYIMLPVYAKGNSDKMRADCAWENRPKYTNGGVDSWAEGGSLKILWKVCLSVMDRAMEKLSMGLMKMFYRMASLW